MSTINGSVGQRNVGAHPGRNAASFAGGAGDGYPSPVERTEMAAPSGAASPAADLASHLQDLAVAAPSTTVLNYITRRLLPTAHERLADVFPEFGWVPDGLGYSGFSPRQDYAGARPEVGRRRLLAFQPWGFVDESGGSQSWWSYLLGSRRPTVEAFIDAATELAQRAGVEPPPSPRDYARQWSLAWQAIREQDLVEAFLACSHWALCTPAGEPLVRRVRQTYGFDPRNMSDVPLGRYTTPKELGDYLRSCGFTADEIERSKVTRDSRLSGRLLIPWRDRFGRLQTVIAEDFSEQNAAPKRLYWRRAKEEDLFGLDWALRDGASFGHADQARERRLVVVQEPWEALSLRTHGLTNGICCGPLNGDLDPGDCQKLYEAGVRRLTLAYADTPEGRREAARTVEASFFAAHSPEVVVLPPGSYATASTPALCVDLIGLEKFQQLAAGALHALAFTANEMIDRRLGPARSRGVLHPLEIHWPQAETASGDGYGVRDHALLALLDEAVEFDGRVYRPGRERDLDERFWPPILKVTGASWEQIRSRLARGTAPFGLSREGLADYEGLMRDLSTAYHDHDQPRFEWLIVEAAGRIRPRYAGSPPVAAAVVRTPPARRQAVREEEQQWHAREQEDPLAKIWRMAAPTSPQYADVSRTAYQVWEERGRPAGVEQECWYEAERRLGLKKR